MTVYDTTNKIQNSHNIYIIPKSELNCNKKMATQRIATVL